MRCPAALVLRTLYPPEGHSGSWRNVAEDSAPVLATCPCSKIPTTGTWDRTLHPEAEASITVELYYGRELRSRPTLTSVSDRAVQWSLVLRPLYRTPSSGCQDTEARSFAKIDGVGHLT
jgi:hypothetical protein